MKTNMISMISVRIRSIFIPSYELCTLIFGINFNMLFFSFITQQLKFLKPNAKAMTRPFKTRFLLNRIRDHKLHEDQIVWIEVRLV